MVSHVGTGLAHWGFALELLNLARWLNTVVFEKSLRSLLMLVGDSLGLGVHLLLSLSLTTIKDQKSINGTLVNDTSLSKSHIVGKGTGVESKTGNVVFSQISDL